MRKNIGLRMVCALVGLLALVGAKGDGAQEKNTPKGEDIKSAKVPKTLDDIVGDWGRGDVGNVKGVRLEIKADGTCWTSYVLLLGGGRFDSTATMSKLKDPPFRVMIAKDPWEIKLSQDGAKLIVIGPQKRTLVLPKMKAKNKSEKGND